MSAEKGLKTYGQRAVDALLKEFSQLDELGVFEGIDSTTLTKRQKQQALESINLIKEKRCGKIKGRSVANGKKQRSFFFKRHENKIVVASFSTCNCTANVLAWFNVAQTRP